MSSYEFPSYNPRDLDRDFPYFQYPKIVGGMSLDDNREFLHDRSQLQILRPENEILGEGRNFNLDIGFENKFDRIETQGVYLDNVLRWILANRHRYDDSKSQIFGADFMTFRGTFRLIMNAPYEKNEGWILRIQKWKDTIFIAEEKTPEKLNKVNTEQENRFMYWGYKFEDLLTTTAKNTCQNDPASKEDLPVNENPEFNCMFVSKIGNFRVQYGAEMDGYMDPKAAQDESIPLQPDKFVEFKTSNAIRHPGQERTLRKFKFMKWWAQCFLVGTENVIVGWKDKDGVVRNVQKISVKECSRAALEWKGNVCFNFLLDVLNFLKKTIVKNSLTTVYRLTWYPDRGFTMETESGTDPFLREWFHTQFQQ